MTESTPSSPNPRSLTGRILDVRLSPEYSWLRSDADLLGLAGEAFQALGPQHFQDLLMIHEPFDYTATQIEEDRSEREVSHWPLRKLLGHVPHYIETAAHAGLDTAQAYGFIQTILMHSSERYSRADQTVVLLTKAFDQHAKQRRPFEDPEDHEALRGIVEETAQSGCHTSAIDAYRALTHVGMPTRQSVNVIREDLFADQVVMDGAISVFNALSIAAVDPESLAGICRAIRGDNPDILQLISDYNLLQELITRVCPAEDIPPNDILAFVNERLSQGADLAAVVGGILDSGAGTLFPRPEVYSAADRRKQHFIFKRDSLEIAALPYRTKRSLDNGLADLQQIARSTGEYREPIGEGLWVFDPAMLIWYSLGGRTEVIAAEGAVRHSYSPYPLGELSEKPMLFHCHPTYFEKTIGLKPGSGVVPDAALPIADRFFAATPSRRDYLMVADVLREPATESWPVRSFIVHGSGVTEYTFPRDVGALEDMGATFQALRNQILAMAKWNRILRQNRGKDEVVGDLIAACNKKLPKGFRLDYFLHPA